MSCLLINGPFQSHEPLELFRGCPIGCANSQDIVHVVLFSSSFFFLDKSSRSVTCRCSSAAYRTYVVYKARAREPLGYICYVFSFYIFLPSHFDGEVFALKHTHTQHRHLQKIVMLSFFFFKTFPLSVKAATRETCFCLLNLF